MSKINILHAEDNAQWQEYIRVAAEKLGHTVVSFSNVEEAKSYTGKVDLYVVDSTMNSYNDGALWAQKLNKEGKAVLIVSGSYYWPDPGIWLINKGDWARGGANRFNGIVNEVASW